MNKGIRQSHGDYLLFLNSGDYFISRHILSKIFSNKKRIIHSDLVIGRQRYIDGIKKMGISPKLHVEEINMEYFLSSTLPHQATFIHRNLFLKCGLYDSSYRVSADWVFWVEAVVKHHCSLQIINKSVSYMDIKGVSSDMTKCHKDMKRYLNNCLQDGTLSWTVLFDMAIKSRSFTIEERMLKNIRKIIQFICKQL